MKTRKQKRKSERTEERRSLDGMVVLRRQLQKHYDKGCSDFPCESKWGRQDALRKVIMAIDDTLKELMSKKHNLNDRICSITTTGVKLPDAPDIVALPGRAPGRC